MHKKYIELFRNLAQATATSAESVMDYNRKHKDDKGLQTAETMRNDFQELAMKIKNAGENYVPTQPEAARLLVAAMIQVNQMQDKISNLKKAMAGYQTDVIPKLQEIVDNAKTDEQAEKLANEKFIIEDNK